MKLSQLPTGRAADVLIQVASSASVIANDTELIGIIGNVMDFKGLNKQGAKAMILAKYSAFIARMLKSHSKELFSILAAINGTDVKTIEEQPVKVTFQQIAELRDDEDLIDFLSSFMPPEKKKQSAPSAPVPETSPREESSPQSPS